jgi:hypothetical protein
MLALSTDLALDDHPVDVAAVVGLLFRMRVLRLTLIDVSQRSKSLARSSNISQVFANHGNHSDDYQDGPTGAMSQAVKIDTARRYLARGWSLLPLRSHDKRPLVAWEPLQSSHPSAEQVADWFGRWPDANIGIVTGEISNLIVLDIDPKHGGDASLDRLERQFGQLPATIEVTTGGGGHHFYFAHPGGLIRSRAGLAQGVDLRGDGGYIVAPPSIHPSGHPYLWDVGHSPEDVALAALPRWILLESGGIRVRRTPSDWRRLVREGVPEGQRNASIAALTGHLLRMPKLPKSFPISFGFISTKTPARLQTICTAFPHTVRAVADLPA